MCASRVNRDISGFLLVSQCEDNFFAHIRHASTTGMPVAMYINERDINLSKHRLIFTELCAVKSVIFIVSS